MIITIQPYLYLLVRTDLQSMNPGKAIAHGAHAANQFVHAVMKQRKTSYIYQLYEKWAKSTPDGFGTTIALAATIGDINTICGHGSYQKTITGRTTDPTYPYLVEPEIATLLTPIHVMPPFPLDTGKVLCHRVEITAGFLFAGKEDAKMLVGHLSLHP